MHMTVVSSAERSEVSLRQALIKFLHKIDYSFASYPAFNDLELAVRNEILSFGVDLRPGWETILRTSCTLIGMAYIKHPIEIQSTIAVCGALSFFYVEPSLILAHARSLRGSLLLWRIARTRVTLLRLPHFSTITSQANHKSTLFSITSLHTSTKYGSFIIPWPLMLQYQP